MTEIEGIKDRCRHLLQAGEGRPAPPSEPPVQVVIVRTTEAVARRLLEDLLGPAGRASPAD